MMQILMHTMEHYNLCGKVRLEISYCYQTSKVMHDGQIGWFTYDEAAVNGTTIHELEKEFDNEDPVWKARDHDIL
jgi:hypothetical protein